MDQQDALANIAFIEGRRAGLGLIPPSLNPNRPGTAAHLQWQQGHYSATFTIKPECIAPNHACPLAAGECVNGCSLKEWA